MTAAHNHRRCPQRRAYQEIPRGRRRQAQEVPTAPRIPGYSDFWASVERWLYGDSTWMGPRNQIFYKAYGWKGGVGSGAKRTEVMKLAADLLHFHDADEERSAQPAYGIWAKHFGAVLPRRMGARCGFGKEFR